MKRFCLLTFLLLFFCDLISKKIYVSVAKDLEKVNFYIKKKNKIDNFYITNYKVIDIDVSKKNLKIRLIGSNLDSGYFSSGVISKILLILVSSKDIKFFDNDNKLLFSCVSNKNI